MGVPLTLRIADALQRSPSAPALVAAYLFRSHATGSPHRESDVDVAVLLREAGAGGARSRFDERLRLGAWLSAELREPAVDLLILNDAPPMLAARVVTEGKPLLCHDPEFEHAFRRDAQLRAADLAPWLERMRRRKLEALAR